MKISNQPPKGFYDWDNQEFLIRKYIFDTWRNVCLKFGYDEYLTPLLENSQIYKAKSGEDVGSKELMVIKDQANRELSIRPEMTPSVTRFVTKIYNDSNKPIRLFSIANFIRNEKPQKGRNREFWQLNFDVFGSSKFFVDSEIIQIAIEILRAFGAPNNSFKVKVNHRKLIENILVDQIGIDFANLKLVTRVLDKAQKIEEKELRNSLKNLNLNSKQIDLVLKFINSDSLSKLKKHFKNLDGLDGFKELQNIISFLDSLGYGKFIEFSTSVIRGFDYYDGMVFEVFDNHPSNNRSLFGGGRYNGLASIFGYEDIPAVGCAPGDETTRIFLENWDLLPNTNDIKKVYVPILEGVEENRAFLLAQELRNEGRVAIVGAEVQTIQKALKFANKANYDYIAIFSTLEAERNCYTLKDLQTGEQVEINLENKF
ncbi:MAG: histidine--tRNA ligase [Candidatus Dojkabacteria bacterium]|nr:MAG: histidine--tRNA ligase [Candidatus Dojkabacteria bacterium]